MSWSIKVDEDARDAAVEAARQSGLSLNDWLREAIAARAAGQGVHGTHAGMRPDELRAVADSIARLTRRIRTMDAGARSTISDLRGRIDEIDATLGRAGTRRDGGDDETLRGVAAMVRRLTRDVDDADETARFTIEGRVGARRDEDMESSASIAQAIRSLETRIAQLGPLAGSSRGTSASAESLDKLKTRLDALLARAASPRPRQSSDDLDNTLRELEARIDRARSRHGARAAGGEGDERMRRIEGRLADIAEHLAGVDPDAPREGARARDDISSAIAAIAARQAALDQRGRDPQGHRDPVADTLAALRSDVAELDERLNAMAGRTRQGGRDHDPQFRRAEAPRSGGSPDANILQDIRRGLEALTAATDSTAREATLLDRFDELIRRSPGRDHLDTLASEVAELRRSLADDGSPVTLARLEMRVSELARTIETSLTARQSATEAAAAGMAATLADIRGAIEDLAASHGTGPDVAAIAGLAANLAEIRGVIEDLGERREPGADPAAIAGLAAGLAEIREMLEDHEAADRTREESLSGRLEGRLDDIVARLDEALVRSPGPDLAESLNQRLEEVIAATGGLAPRSDDIAALDAIRGEIAALREDIIHREPPRMDYLESQIHDLAVRLESVVAESDSEQLAELEARVARLAGELEHTAPRSAMLGQLEEHLTRLQATLAEGRRESIEEARLAAREAVREFADHGTEESLLAALRRDLDQIRGAVDATDERTGERLQSLQGTLAAVVDRLGQLEDDAGAEKREPARAAATGTFGPEPGIPRAPARATIAAGTDRTSRPAPADVKPVPAEETAPVEPGDAERKPVDRRAEFIAAARRAAQAAVAEAGPAVGETAAEVKPSPFARIGQAIRNRKKPLLLAAAAIVLAIGAMHLFGPGADEATDVASRPVPATVEAASPEAAPVQRVADGAGAPTVPRVDQVALVAPPANARTAMALASVETVGDRFANAFAGSRVPGGEAETLPADGLDPDLPLIGSERLRNAAIADDPAAAFEIANRLAEGRGTDRDLDAAAAWYERAASAGLAIGQYRLGSLYERGQGVGKDVAEAVRWYQRAADQGNIGAMHNLAVLLSEGAAGSPDHARALEWFLAAANYGVKDSQYNLGVIYARGFGRAPDLVESYRWFAIAAAAGDDDAAARRDEVGGMLTPDELAEARAAVRAWQPKPPLVEANSVVQPEGGWDGTDGVTATEQKALVMKIQALLAEQGYDPGPADGIDGPKTREAIRAFQRTIGIADTGVIDRSLVAALAGGGAG